MSKIAELDARSVDSMRQICWQIEKSFGMSNYFLLKLLTGAYATCVIAIVILTETQHTSSQSGNNVFLFFLFLWFFYVSFFYCDRAERIARERRKENLENPKKQSVIYVGIRCSMLASLLLLILFFILMTLQFPDRMSELPFLSYAITSCATSLLFWVGLLLDACDPLKEKDS